MRPEGVVLPNWFLAKQLESIDEKCTGFSVKYESCILQNTTWQVTTFYSQSDIETYAS